MIHLRVMNRNGNAFPFSLFPLIWFLNSNPPVLLGRPWDYGMQSPASLQCWLPSLQHEFGQHASPGKQQNEAGPNGSEPGAKQHRLSLGQHPWKLEPQQWVPEWQQSTAHCKFMIKNSGELTCLATSVATSRTTHISSKQCRDNRRALHHNMGRTNWNKAEINHKANDPDLLHFPF